MFCKYCGKELAENEVCTCPESVAASEAQEQKGGFVKELLTQVKETVHNVGTTGLGWAQMGVVAGAELIVSLLGWLVILCGLIEQYNKSLSGWYEVSISDIDGFAAQVILSGLLSLVVPVVLGLVAVVVVYLIKKKNVDFRACLSALVSAQLLPTVIVLLAGLMFLLGTAAGIVCLLLAAMVGLISLIKILEAELGEGNGILRCALLGVIAVAVLAVCVLVLKGNDEFPVLTLALGLLLA